MLDALMTMIICQLVLLFILFLISIWVPGRGPRRIMGNLAITLIAGLIFCGIAHYLIRMNKESHLVDRQLNYNYISS